MKAFAKLIFQNIKKKFTEQELGNHGTHACTASLNSVKLVVSRPFEGLIGNMKKLHMTWGYYH